MLEGQYEIVVVVNSDDPDEHLDLQCKVVFSGENIGFGQACNYGASLLSSDQVMFVNPDVRLVDDVVLRLSDMLSRDSSVGILAPHSGGDRIVVEQSQRCVSAGGRNVGSCFIMKRSLFSRMGGFDPAFFLWWEDTDLRDRVRMFGYKVCLANGLVVSHSGGHSTSSDSCEVGSSYLTKVWICSHFYYLKKHRGLLVACLWCLLMTVKNIVLATFRPDRVSGRGYSQPRVAWRFGIYLLARLHKYKQNVVYGKDGYAWESGRGNYERVA